MAFQRFEKGSEEWQMFMDYWGLCQSLWVPEDTEEYWNDAYNRCRKFGEKYSGCCGKLSNSLALGLLNHLDAKRNK